MALTITPPLGGIPMNLRNSLIHSAITLSLPAMLCAAEAEPIASEVTTAEARRTFLETRYTDLINKYLAGPLSDETEKGWGEALWNAAHINERGPVVRDAVRRALIDAPHRSADFRLVTMRSVYTLFPNELIEETRDALAVADASRTFAMGAYQLLRAGGGAADRQLIRTLMENKFPEWQEDPRLEWLSHRLEISPVLDITVRPALGDLLRMELPGEKPIVFSFQRLNRQQPGLAVIRQPDGRFHRNPDGSIFRVGQLAMARTDLPGTITYGNSPQGVYTIQGTGTARNPWIGPTPYLYSQVPIESPLHRFVHGTVGEDDAWDDVAYLELLPESWRNYFPIREAWYAGRAGRSEMLMHGTTIDPNHYQGASFFPFTPSAGCLCTLEFWAPESGERLYSEQATLVEAFRAAGGPFGYLVVVELDDTPRAVAMEDVIVELLAAE